MVTSHSIHCNKIVQETWAWAIKNNKWLTVSHILGIENILADAEFRRHDTRMEWKLNPKKFEEIVEKLQVHLDVDLFASRLNYQFKPFVSFWSDPEASSVDAFLFDWNSFTFYALEFSRKLQKIDLLDCLLFQIGLTVCGMHNLNV